MRRKGSGLPASVEALNQLLLNRRGEDHRLRRALIASYLTHGALLTLLVLGTRTLPGTAFTGVPSLGIMPVTPLYGLGGGEAARSRTPERTTTGRKVEPLREEPGPKAEPADRSAVPIATPSARRPTPRPEPDVRRDGGSRPDRRATGRADDPSRRPADGLSGGADGLGPAQGGPGSPLGRLDGDPQGGLSSLVFGNLWYVYRVRDIIYSYWSNPFLRESRPAASFEVVVSFQILRDGTIQDPRILRSSGNLGWDRAGLRAVENARLPPLPPDYPRPSVVVSYSFEYDPSR